MTIIQMKICSTTHFRINWDFDLSLPAMKQNRTIRNQQIVFSRWSRKSYAIFCSLGKTVKIARLSIDICRMAMMKSAVLKELQQLFASPKNHQDDATEQEPQPLTLLQWMLLVPANQTMETNPAGSIILYNLITGVCNGTNWCRANTLFYFSYGY